MEVFGLIFIQWWGLERKISDWFERWYEQDERRDDRGVMSCSFIFFIHHGNQFRVMLFCFGIESSSSEIGVVVSRKAIIGGSFVPNQAISKLLTTRKPQQDRSQTCHQSWFLTTTKLIAISMILCWLDLLRQSKPSRCTLETLNATERFDIWSS